MAAWYQTAAPTTTADEVAPSDDEEAENAALLADGAATAAAAAAVICAQASSHSCRVVKRGVVKRGTGVRCGECVDVQLWKERRCDRSASGGTL